MASAGDAKILLLDFTMPFLAGGCVEIRLAARERLHGQPFIIRPPEAPKCGELEWARRDRQYILGLEFEASY